MCDHWFFVAKYRRKMFDGDAVIYAPSSPRSAPIPIVRQYVIGSQQTPHSKHQDSYAVDAILAHTQTAGLVAHRVKVFQA